MFHNNFLQHYSNIVNCIGTEITSGNNVSPPGYRSLHQVKYIKLQKECKSNSAPTAGERS